MAVVFQTFVTAEAHLGGASGSLSVGVPAGLTTDDLWIISTTADASAGVAGVQIEPGFTAVSPQFDYGASDWPFSRSQWKKAGASESSQSIDFTGDHYRVRAVSMRFSGQHLAAPIGNVAEAADVAGGTTSEAINAADITIQTAGSIAIAHSAHYVNNGDVALTNAPPAGMTQIAASSTDWVGHNIAYQAVDAGTFAPGNFTVTAASNNVFQLTEQTFEIIPAPAVSGWNLTGTGPRVTHAVGTPIGAGAVQAWIQGTQSGAGSVAGVSAQAYAALSGAAAGTVLDSAASAQSFAPLAGGAVATVEVKATSPQSYAALAGISAGTVGSGVSAVSAQSYAAVAGTASAAVLVAGSASQSYGPVAGTAAAVIEVKAAATQSYSPLAGASATTVRVTGTSSGAYAYLGASAAAVEVKGASPQSYAPLGGTAQAVIGAAPIAAASTQSYAPVTGAVTAGVEVKAASTQTYAAVTGAGAALVGVAAASVGSYAYLGAGQAGIEVRGVSSQSYVALAGAGEALLTRLAVSAQPYASLAGLSFATVLAQQQVRTWVAARSAAVQVGARHADAFVLAASVQVATQARSAAVVVKADDQQG